VKYTDGKIVVEDQHVNGGLESISRQVIKHSFFGTKKLFTS